MLSPESGRNQSLTPCLSLIYLLLPRALEMIGIKKVPWPFGRKKLLDWVEPVAGSLPGLEILLSLQLYINAYSLVLNYLVLMKSVGHTFLP